MAKTSMKTADKKTLAAGGVLIVVTAIASKWWNDKCNSTQFVSLVKKFR
jgi:hypothetical protein